MKFFLQVISSRATLIQISDLVPFGSDSVVRALMSDYFNSYDDVGRVVAFIVDEDGAISVYSVLEYEGGESFDY